MTSRLASVPVALLVALAGCQSARTVDPALVDRAKQQDAASVKSMVKGGVDPNSRAPDGTVALHWAVHNDDVALVEALLRAGAELNVVNDYGATPLTEAATVGNVEVIRKLVGAGADVDLANADGQTALMILARTSNVEAVQALLQKGADINAREKWRGQSPLMWAAAQSQPEMVRFLIANGADVNARSIVNNWERQISGEPRGQARPAGGLTPLLFAARQGCLECVKLLVEAGAEVDMVDPEGVTPLLVAINSLHFDVASYLLDKGASPNRWDWWGRTPLYSVVDMNTVPFGGRPDRASMDATTGLQLMQKLLEAGANPNAQLKLFPPFRALGADRGADGLLTIGTTPLLRAAKAGDIPAMRLLLEHGANPTLPNMLRVTPLMAAAGVRSLSFDTRGRFKTEAEAAEAVDILLKAGASADGADNRGQTALHGAAIWGWNDVIRRLVAANARLDVKDARGFTPLDAALGRAGGLARGGQGVQVHEDSAELIRQYLAEKVASR